MVAVPGGSARRVRFSDVSREVEALSPTACDTGRALSDVIAARATGDKTVIVVTDQDVADRRVTRLWPEEAVQDVGITRISVREVPSTQAMVELRNQSSRAKASVRVSSGAVQQEREVDLPASPGARAYFFDLQSVTDVVGVQILGADGNTANDLAWAVREKAFPRIEARSSLSPSVSRIVEAYGKARPGGDSARVLVVNDASVLPSTEKGAIVLPAEVPSQDAVLASDHEITRHVNFQSISHLKRTAAPPPEGWTPVVTAGPNVLVAIKPSEPRQVWIGFDADGWESTTDFVILWTNVFDFLGATKSAGFVCHPLADWTAEWNLDNAKSGEWPGLYTRSDGQKRAFNAPDVIVKSTPLADWQSRVAQISARNGAIELSPEGFLLALACLVASLALWQR